MLLAPERVVELYEPALAILERMDGTATLPAIAGALAVIYDADAAEIEADARALIDDLALRGYVAA